MVLSRIRGLGLLVQVHGGSICRRRANFDLVKMLALCLGRRRNGVKAPALTMSKRPRRMMTIMSLNDDDKHWIKAELRDIETRLLTAFHDWASPNGVRVDSHSAALRALDVGYEDLRSRVAKLEQQSGGRKL